MGSHLSYYVRQNSQLAIGPSGKTLVTWSYYGSTYFFPVSIETGIRAMGDQSYYVLTFHSNVKRTLARVFWPVCASTMNGCYPEMKWCPWQMSTVQSKIFIRVIDTRWQIPYHSRAVVFAWWFASTVCVAGQCTVGLVTSVIDERQSTSQENLRIMKKNPCDWYFWIAITKTKY